MVNRTIIASGTTRIIGVGIKTKYTPGPAPRLLPVNGALVYNVINVATGSPLVFAWPDFAGSVFTIEVRRVNYTDLGVQQVVAELSTLARSISLQLGKAGLYNFRVRNGFGQSIDSMDHSADGARGWIVQAYLAPVSGGGIK